VQGGTHPALRVASVRGILDTDEWIGVAIGGLSVGEAKPAMYDTVATCEAQLPADRPRYLMGVGFPDDLLECVARGVDLFDCVAPSRMGRDGTAFTPDGKVQVRRSDFRFDRRPLVEDCSCEACTHYDRAFLRHLFVAHEPLGPRLLALHNVSFVLALMEQARAHIAAGTFTTWHAAWLTRYRAADGADEHTLPRRATDD
jgi:queuine tRNA-ribosyltransferase